jgi:hypothetical protein
MGLYLYQTTMDGFILQCLYKQGIYLWRYENRPEEAKEWFLKAARHGREMMRRRYPEGYVSPLFGERAAFYEKMPGVIDLHERARSGRREDELAFVAAVQGILTEQERIDEQYLWNRFDPASPLQAMKRTLAGDRDPQECNETIDMAALIFPDRPVAAALEPEGLDVDVYVFERPAPEVRGHDEEPLPPPPLPVEIAFTRPDTARMDLKVTVLDGNRTPVASGEIRGSGEVRFVSRGYGEYYVKVEPLSPALPWPADTRYGFQVRMGP